ncbi:MAG: branched-chain amino acid transaminase [Bdellovibrionota bacterium]
MFDHEKLKVFCRGEIVDFKDATISIANSGFLYGLGVFTGIRAHYNSATGKLYIFRPDAHFARLQFACKIFRYSNFLETYDYPKFLGILKDLIRVNDIREDTYIRVSNFSDENRITPKFIYKDSLSAFLYPLGDYVPTGGMRCMISSWTRVDDNSIPSRPKTHGGYVNTAFAKTEALQNGFDEAIFLDRHGHVVEGSAENIFVVIGGKVITPPASDNILEGITRDTVLTIIRDLKLPHEERTIARSELYKADEIFLTGTGAKVSPVTEIDRYQIGSGKVGPISQKIQDVYFKAVKGECSEYMHWLSSAFD